MRSKESDKEEMKEILEMKRVHDRLAKKRQIEREQREHDRIKMRDKALEQMQAMNVHT